MLYHYHPLFLSGGLGVSAEAVLVADGAGAAATTSGATGGDGDAVKLNEANAGVDTTINTNVIAAMIHSAVLLRRLLIDGLVKWALKVADRPDCGARSRVYPCTPDPALVCWVLRRNSPPKS